MMTLLVHPKKRYQEVHESFGGNFAHVFSYSQEN